MTCVTLHQGIEVHENVKKLEELVHFLQESTGACILFELQMILNFANHTAKLTI
jgi:hypothetical protein